MTDIQPTFTAGDYDQAADRSKREPKLRFTVGEEYIFLVFHATFVQHGPDGKAFWRTSHAPNRDILKEIRSMKLKCKSHHRVPIHYYENDPESKADGFIFVDESTGEEWYNQYPKASYGQLDDSNDRYILRAKIFTDNKSEAEAFSAMSRDEQDFFMAHWVLATNSFDDIQYSINTLNDSVTDANRDWNMKAVGDLVMFQIELCDYMRKEYGLAVVHEPYVFGKGTDKEVVSRILKARFVPGKYWIKWPGAAQFRGEGEWLEISEVPTGNVNKPMTILDWESINKTMFLPTKFQPEKPTE